MPRSSDEEWGWLLAALDEWGSAAEVGPGRIEVLVPGSGRRVLLVMTPEEWREDVAGTGFGSRRDALAHVKETLRGLRPHESCAVYRDCRLEPSTAPTLPEDDDLPPGPGEWTVVDRDGRVVARFADSADEAGQG